MDEKEISSKENGKVFRAGSDFDPHAYEHALGALNENQIKEARRLEFPLRTKRILAARVGYRCSNPSCKMTSTIGPGDGPDEVVILGEAAHIVGAIQDGEDSLSPRADPHKNPDEIKSVGNGIWLCRNCHKLVDARDSTYTVETLRDWKNEAERRQKRVLEEQPSSFVEEYVWPSIKLDKGITTEGFADKEWCLLAYMLNAHDSTNYGLEFGTGEGYFEDDYRSWMSEHSIKPKRSGLNFTEPGNGLNSALRKIVGTLAGLVKMNGRGLDYGDGFKEFMDEFYEQDPNGLENLIYALSCLG